ncbi:MAG: Na+:solute symporter [Prevotella sp.]|jgi:SSS family solute:Na+ symporter|nr:Na+:solute symporter [Prevotella sp.]MCI1282021.1 Na+:solute symporter [Prevotella sp.]
MHLLDYITIGVFMAGILLAGLSFSSSGKNMKSFFAAGGQVPWWISGLSLFMGFFSAGTFVVWGSIAYSYGWVAITIQTAMCIAGFGVGLFIAPKWHDTGAMTVAEHVNKKLGHNVQKMYTYLFLLISVFTTGSFLYPVAKIVEVSTGFPLQYSILLLGAISILYVTVGGLWAVVVTDVLQFVILTAAVLIVVPLSFNCVDGVSSFIDKCPQGFFHLFNGEYTPLFIIAFTFYNLFFLGGNWSYVQRYTSVGKRKDARKVGLLFGCLYIFCPILWMLPPMIYRAINPDLAGLADEGAYLLMCKQALPSGLLGLMLGGMIFATASSLNGTLNISAGVFTNDIYKRLFPSTREDKLMKIARYSTIGFGLMAIVIALLIPLMGGIVNVVISIAALTGVPLYLPVIWSLFSKRQTAKSVMAATLISLALNGIFKFITPYTIGFSLDRAMEMLAGVAFPIIILTAWEIYAAITGKKNTYVYEGAEPQKEPIAVEEKANEGEAQATSGNTQGLKVIGLGISASGCIITILGLMADHGQAIVCTISSVLILVGLYCIYKSRSKK